MLYERQINPDSFYERESELDKCKKCDYYFINTYPAGKNDWGYEEDDLVCSKCLNEIHE